MSKFKLTLIVSAFSCMIAGVALRAAAQRIDQAAGPEVNVEALYGHLYGLNTLSAGLLILGIILGIIALLKKER